MNTSSTTTTPPASVGSPTAARAAARAILGCPDWCELETREHDPSVASMGPDNDGGVVIVTHFGPMFGLLMAKATTHNGVPQEMVAELSGVELTVDELHRLAADALAAIDWLEVQQPRSA
jgi:hypothetical protein